MAVNTNSTALTGNLPLTYRQAETTTIARCLRAGDSCSVVGVSGMAKSNLFRHLLQAHVRQHYLGDDWQSYFFVAADLNALSQISEQALCELLLSGINSELWQAGADAALTAHLENLQQRAFSSSDVLIWKRSFAQSVQALMTSTPSRHLIFLFDQFDEVYKTLPPHFFANLRSIRDQYKYRISYVLFTRDELPRLCHALECEEFYELLSSNVIGLGPYNYDDALCLLMRVTGRYDQPISETAAKHLIEVSGGHPGILKAACIAVLQDKMNPSWHDAQEAESFLASEDVTAECVKLWESISADEQRSLRAIVMDGTEAAQDVKTVRSLKLKKLLTGNAQAPALCAIFTKYILELKVSNQAETKVQAGPLKIDVAGEVHIGERLIVPPLTKKEFLLLEYFCLKPGRLSSRDEIIAVVYPDEYRAGDMVSDEALNALVRRLRERIEPYSKGQCRISTIRGKGYRLEVS